MEPWIKPVFLKGDRLFIIDQRLLPGEEKYRELTSVDEVAEAIKTLAVRGAPAIGIAAAYGVYIEFKNKADKTEEKNIPALLDGIIQRLASTRPTAYNLFWALERMRRTAQPVGDKKILLDRLRREAEAIHDEDLSTSEQIARNGQAVIPDIATVLTHCNAGGLATGGGGTALAPLFMAHREGKKIRVYVDETRPLLQGARLTAWELGKMGIDYTVITDNMAGTLMKKGAIDLVLLGADRIAANGDFANKIGTYSLAVLASYHSVPFYTAAPVSTFDLSLPRGEAIIIEERDKSEVLAFRGVNTAPPDAQAYNPAFDVTPSNLLTGIITEKGIIYPPFRENIRNMLEEQNGV